MKICLFCLALMIISSCATSPKNNTVPKKDAVVLDNTNSRRFYLYDNCPEITEALKVRMALEATIYGYHGFTTFQYALEFDKDNIFPIYDYKNSCESIKFALEKSSGKKYFVKYNTKPDFSGDEIFLDTEENIHQSLDLLVSKNSFSIYAIYVECR